MWWEWFGPQDFMARWHCGEWGALGWWSQLVNFTIFFCYMVISSTLLALKADRYFPSVPVYLFAGFIFCCGLTHLCEVLTFWWPAYRVFFVVDVCTAVISFTTASTSPIIVRWLLRSHL